MISQNGLIFIYFGGVTNLVIVSAILECMAFLTDETNAWLFRPMKLMHGFFDQ